MTDDSRGARDYARPKYTHIGRRGVAVALTRKIKIGLFTLAAVAVLCISGKLLVDVLFPTDLRTQLAKVLGVRPSVFWINLPPAKRRLPGAAFVYDNTLLPIDGVEVDSADISAGAEFELGWVNSTGSLLNANADATVLSLAYGDNAHLRVQLRAAHCRILEVGIDKLKQRILHSDGIRSQVADGRKPLVIVRSYEGLLTIEIAKTKETSAEMWTQVKSSAAASAAAPDSKVAVNGTGDDTLQLTFQVPIVFAYEMVEAKLITKHLGVEPDDVDFTPIAEPAAARPTTVQQPTSMNVDPRRWILATAAISDFPKTPWLQQDWNRHSAEFVEQRLATFAPTETMQFRTTSRALSSGEKILAFATDTAARARAVGAKFIVFYYVGHAITSAAGDILLLQSGVTPTALKALSVAAEDGASHTANTAMAVKSETALALPKVHAALNESRIPFVILLDGCMESSRVQQSMEAAGFRYDPAHPTLYYIGNDPLTSQVIDNIASSMRDFAGPWEYLHDTNPVVLAAKPGTLAMVSEDSAWESALPLAPLARKIDRLLRPSTGDVLSSLDQLLDRMIDFRQGVGELELDGSITWSDLSVFERMARVVERIGLRLPYTDVSNSVIRRYEPGIGPIGGFAFSSAHRQLILLSQGNDWKVWSWQVGNKPRLISNQLRFPMIAATSNGRVYLHHDDEKTLAVLTDAMKLATIQSPLYVERIAAGRAPGELLIAGESASVDEMSPLFVLRNGQLEEIDYFVTSGLWSMAPSGSEGIAYTRDAGSTIMFRTQGRETPLARNLIEPGQLANIGDSVYCLSRSKLRIYRVSVKGVAAASLLDGKGEALLEIDRDPDGFQATPDGTLLVTSGSSIYEIAPDKLAWTLQSGTGI